jgi:hypothetical protein
MTILLLSVFLLLFEFVYSWKEGSLPSSADCTWKYIEQPLSHFARGINSQTYEQRICVYDGYWQPNQGLPVFFYTGNVIKTYFHFLLTISLGKPS